MERWPATEWVETVCLNGGSPKHTAQPLIASGTAVINPYVRYSTLGALRHVRFVHEYACKLLIGRDWPPTGREIMMMRWISAGRLVYSREMLAHRRVNWLTVSRDIADRFGASVRRISRFRRGRGLDG